MSSSQIARELLADSEIEGVTFLGGEPFDQALGLAAVARLVREAGKTVMVFTGYRLEHLRSDRVDGAAELLAVTDLLVDGPYLKARTELARPWVGSSNQRFLPLTAKGEPGGLSADRIELRVTAGGVVEINGWAPDATMAALRLLVES